jgi:hypothetical protein
MKNLILIIACFGFFCSNAQNALQGTGHTPYALRQATYKKSYPYATVLAGYDTLSAGDTGYVQYQFPNKQNMVFDLNVLYLTGTLAGTAVLMGSSSSSMPSPASSTWKVLTGKVTYCAGCTAASATLTGTGTTNYQWHVGEDGSDYQNFMIRITPTGTVTATYSSTAGSKN